MYKKNFAREIELECFMRKNAGQFSPIFDGGGIGLPAYSKKIKTYGNTIEFWQKETELAGLLAYYENPEKSYIYITYICVNINMQGKGIATKLLQQLEHCTKFPHFEWRLEVSKTNSPAIKLYQKWGFNFSESRNNKWLMIRSASLNA